MTTISLEEAREFMKAGERKHREGKVRSAQGIVAFIIGLGAALVGFVLAFSDIEGAVIMMLGGNAFLLLAAPLIKEAGKLYEQATMEFNRVKEAEIE